MGSYETLEDARRQMYQELDDMEAAGFNKVRWLTAQDVEPVCPLCNDREGKIYTLEEARLELQKEFCEPEDPDERCRCCFTLAKEYR